jgi:hypothetical protein
MVVHQESQESSRNEKQVCQMVNLHTKNPNFGTPVNINFGIFHGNLEYLFLFLWFILGVYVVL